MSLYVLFWPRSAGPTGPAGADKLVHAVVFALLAATTRWRFGSATRLPVAVAAYAALSELVQAVVLTERSGEVRDLVADLVGAALGWLLAGRPATSRRAAGGRSR